ncbi:hypothetical protein [Streptomyces niveus]|uniref:hypothetical protein n=1 Tax=Streptomyces niveus TaxID=193462 RepID=UPI00341E6D27
MSDPLSAGPLPSTSTDENEIVYVDQGVMNALKVQRERQELWKERLGSRWGRAGPSQAGRHSKVTNDLDAGENPVEVSANVRHHSPGYTMVQYGKRRVQGARKLASGTAERIGLGRIG